jgi:YegS/Rv2252/BmrU family lipid kinase
VTETDNQYFFVVNPNSKGRKTGKDWDKNEKTIREYLGNDFDYKLADGIGTGREITQNAIKDGYDTIIGVGGEGTINEVINGVMDTNSAVPVGFIRSGTANDFLSENVYNWAINLEEQLDAIKSNKTRLVPLPKVTGDETRYSLNMADAGIGAAVSYDASIKRKLTWIRGEFRYTLLALLNALKWKYNPAVIKFDDETVEGDLTLFMAGFSKMGGGFQTLPQASLNDDKMAYLFVKDFSRLKILKFLNTVKKGRHSIAIKGIYMDQASKIYIETENPILFEVDGEPFSYEASKIMIEAVPNALRIIDHKKY